jgi:hypothetical protein
MPSVLRPWVMQLTLREQGTLLAGTRGCDLVPKRPYDSPPRQLVSYLRYVTMVPADQREVGIPGSFMQDQPPNKWSPSDLGHLPEHFYSHIMHAYEVVGYQHPEIITASHCEAIYLRFVEGMHLRPETRLQMLERMTEDRLTTGTVVS